MKETNDRLIENHEYDGIQEYDNPLPRWWALTFFFTCLFAFLYWIHYESGAGPTSSQELAQAMKELENRKQSPALVVSDDDLLAQANNAGALGEGQAIFAGKCVACHGDNLQGVIGPNLTDEYWLHGKGTAKDIIGVVRKGVADKGMPPWDGLLKPKELAAVASYVFSKKGSHPANPKPPQGEKVP